MSGDWSEKVVITKVDGLFNCLSVTFPDGLHSAKKRQYSTLAFTLQVRKITEHINRGTELLTDTNRSVESSASVARTDRPVLPDVSSFHFVEKVCFPHRLNFSRKPQPVPWCGRRKMKPENPRETDTGDCNAITYHDWSVAMWKKKSEYRWPTNTG